jgi:hypothetical protein
MAARIRSWFCLQFKITVFYLVGLFVFALFTGCSSQALKSDNSLLDDHKIAQVCRSGEMKILSVNNKNLDKANKDIEKLKNSGCQCAVVNLNVVFKASGPQIELAKQKLKAEFSQRDKDIVDMLKNVNEGTVSEDELREMQRKFKQDFEKRSKNELWMMQQDIVQNVQIVAKNEKYNIVVVDSTDDVKGFGLDDLTLKLIRHS